MKIETYSQGKLDGITEDYFGHNETSFIIADGASDKSGRKYKGQTSGEIISRAIVEETLSCNNNGTSLVIHLNDKIRNLYKKVNNTEALKDPKFRFSSGFICARIIGDKVRITYLGDLGFRINGNFVYQEVKQVDLDNSQARAKYIQKTSDIRGSRDHIMPLLLKQFEYQNNPNHPLGYGVIDGTHTPEKFIRTFEYNLSDIKTIELFTDGYFKVPNQVSISAWEEAYKEVEQEDPHKWKKYKSTKATDDRTIAIIRF